MAAGGAPRPCFSLAARGSRSKPASTPAHPTPTHPRPPAAPTPQHKVFVGGVNLGRQVVFMAQKLGGGVTVMDLESGRSLASIWYRWADADRP
jgi:hypothetical protein